MISIVAYLISNTCRWICNKSGNHSATYLSRQISLDSRHILVMPMRTGMSTNVISTHRHTVHAGEWNTLSRYHDTICECLSLHGILEGDRIIGESISYKRNIATLQYLKDPQHPRDANF